MRFGDDFDCMEIREERKAPSEFIKDWTESGSVDLDVNNSESRNNNIELGITGCWPTGHIEQDQDLELKHMVLRLSSCRPAIRTKDSSQVLTCERNVSLRTISFFDAVR